MAPHRSMCAAGSSRCLSIILSEAEVSSASSSSDWRVPNAVVVQTNFRGQSVLQRCCSALWETRVFLMSLELQNHPSAPPALQQNPNKNELLQTGNHDNPDKHPIRLKAMAASQPPPMFFWVWAGHECGTSCFCSTDVCVSVGTILSQVIISSQNHKPSLNQNQPF